jgi:hypothetical protein
MGGEAIEGQRGALAIQTGTGDLSPVTEFTGFNRRMAEFSEAFVSTMALRMASGFRIPGKQLGRMVRLGGLEQRQTRSIKK